MTETALDVRQEIDSADRPALPTIEDVMTDWAAGVADLSPFERRAAIVTKAAVLEVLVEEPLAYAEHFVEVARGQKKKTPAKAAPQDAPTLTNRQRFCIEAIRGNGFDVGLTADMDELHELKGLVLKGLTEAEVLSWNGSTPQDAPEASATPKPRPRIYTLPELAAMEPEQVDWVWRPYVGAGDVCSCEGPPKSGKSTFIRKLSAHVVTGREFLGEPVKRGPVLYCTEERAGTTREGFERAGALQLADLHILFRHEARRLDWAETVEQIDVYCREHGIVLVVIDTLSKWAGLRGEEEQGAGFAMEAVGPLQDTIAAHGAAVIVVRHERKSGGTTGEAGRGSSAFAGDVDTITSVRKVSGERTQRRLGAVSRHDATPDDVVIDLVDGEYRCLGDPSELRRREQERGIVDVLPRSRAEQVTVDQLRECADGNVSADTVRRLLLRLVDEGVVCKAHGEVPEHPRSDGFWLRGDYD